MKAVTPDILAPWLHNRMTELEFGAEPIHPGQRSIGLTISLVEEVDDRHLKDLRFELLIPINDQVFSRIVFEVEDVLSHLGIEPRYQLRLMPPQRTVTDDEGRTSVVRDMHDFLALSDGMVRIDDPRQVEELPPGQKPDKLEWRNGYSALRFYHPEHPERCVEIANEGYVAVPDTRPESVMTTLTGQALTPEDEAAIDAMIDLAEEAFANPHAASVPTLESLRAERLRAEEPSPQPRAASESDGVPKTLLDVTGSEPVDEFVLDDENIERMIVSGELEVEEVLTPAEIEDIAKDLAWMDSLLQASATSGP